MRIGSAHREIGLLTFVPQSPFVMVDTQGLERKDSRSEMHKRVFTNELPDPRNQEHRKQLVHYSSRRAEGVRSEGEKKSSSPRSDAHDSCRGVHNLRLGK